ncbi:MAG: hypothetical protein AMXMBFR7_46590 [Planctomycetota bacterium]
MRVAEAFDRFELSRVTLVVAEGSGVASDAEAVRGGVHSGSVPQPGSGVTGALGITCAARGEYGKAHEGQCYNLSYIRATSCAKCKAVKRKCKV